jgi:hypothetical protein
MKNPLESLQSTVLLGLVLVVVLIGYTQYFLA